MSLDNDTFTYPGTTQLDIKTSLSEATKSVLSEITISTHTGTHIDAPNHAIEGGVGIDSIKLEKLIGNCRVLDFTSCKECISLSNLKTKNIQRNEKVLFKTRNSALGFSKIFPNFIYLSPEGASYLAEKEVDLVGIDSLSIKQKGSPDNSPHTVLLSKEIPILEGLDLSQVEEGHYFLIVLPLNFKGIDGSPARAVLLT